MKGLLTVVVLAGISAGVFALGTFRRESDDKPLLHIAEELAINVQVAKPEQKEVIRLVQAPGDVEAVLEVDISSEIVSKIEEMPIEEGDFVSKGDLVCRLNDEQLRALVESGLARVASLKAAVSLAEADHEKADRDLKRQIRWSENNVTSVQEMLDYQTAFKRASAVLEMRKQELTEVEAALKRANEDLKRTVITSPIDGVISRLNAKQGEVVITGTMNNPGTVIMSISDLSRMQVRTRIDEIDVPLVKAGQRANIYLQSDQDRPVPGRVLRVASKGVKPTGRDVVTFEAIIEVMSQDQRIKPGMTANVEIEVAKHARAITVPVEAVVHRLRKELADDILADFDRRQIKLGLSERARQAQYIKVLYVMENDEARLRLITTGIADSKRVELLEGAALDDTVIVGPYRSLDQLRDGKKVALLEEGKKEGEAQPGEKEEAEPAEQAAAQKDVPEPSEDENG
ncbi:MAG: efflux RND transporter periplasmic adaptor subunit [Planctomycetota bacterium]|nr:efflux RND transporter periplasmic adaptor subunit [Planctomycetota bacterium]